MGNKKEKEDYFQFKIDIQFTFDGLKEGEENTKERRSN